MADEAHKRLGDYEIVRELGHGGMGQVYLVRNLISDRIEAMKVLLPDLAQQGDLANRFLREIKVLASLEHPNIAQLRTAFTAENQLVMIMEYVEGDTLAERLQAGPFTPANALNYMGQVLTALSYAHGKGVIHRHQAGEHDADAAGRREANGLRHRPFYARPGNDGDRHDARIA